MEEPSVSTWRMTAAGVVDPIPPTAPKGQSDSTTPRTPGEGTPNLWYPGKEPAAPAQAGQTPAPPDREPARPGKRSPTGQSRKQDPGDLGDEESGEQEPDTTERSPTQDNPAGQKPWDFTL